MINRLYTWLFTCGLLFSLPYFFLTRRFLLKGLYERLGFVPIIERSKEAPCLWVHAVSVGEVRLLVPVIEQLDEMLPSCQFHLSTTTATGKSVAYRQFPQLQQISYFPIDWPSATRRALRRIQPDLFIAVETELWPNFLRECRKLRIPTAVINGRFSERSFRYYRLVRPFLRDALSSVDHFLMQSEQDAGRAQQLGVNSGRIEVTGNLKYDQPPPPSLPVLKCIEQMARDRPILVAGSTREGEEEQILQSFVALKQRRDILLILAPRHPERFDKVENLLMTMSLTFRRRSRLESMEPPVDVLLLDSVGELASIYRLATLAFVGGTLAPFGGHNVLEPAARGVPVIFGPSTENISPIAQDLLQRGGGMQVKNAGELTSALEQLFGDQAEYGRHAHHAKEVVQARQGAASRTVARILTWLNEAASNGTIRR